MNELLPISNLFGATLIALHQSWFRVIPYDVDTVVTSCRLPRGNC
jgi:hypothetical protein